MSKTRREVSATNAFAYDHHIITGTGSTGSVPMAVDVFDDGSVHIYDDENPTEDQVSLSPEEADQLLAILQSRTVDE